MAQNLWDQAIDKNVNWAGDTSTGGAPVSGQYVQKFIKDTLESKWGYLNYDEANMKYQIFADQENYNKYVADPITNGSLLLFTFDAPAPATIAVTVNSKQQVTAILGQPSENNVIKFQYYIEDSAKQAVAESVTMRVEIKQGASTVVKSKSLPVNYDTFGSKPGTSADFDLAPYLTTEGAYTIKVTLTGDSTQATSNFQFMYNVVDLSIDCSRFDNLSIIDNNAQSFSVPFTITGAPGVAKTTEIFIDGEMLFQEHLGWGELASTSGENVGTKSPITSTFDIYLKDKQGNKAKWPEEKWPSNNAEFTNLDLAGKEIFTPGKHSMQLCFFIPGTNPGEKIYSQTVYLDFIISNPDTTDVYTYVIYNAMVGNGDGNKALFAIGEPIEVRAEQYKSTEFSFGAVTTNNSPATIKYDLNGTYVKNGEQSTWSEELSHTIASGTTDKFNYNFMNHSEGGSAVMKVIAGDSDTPDVIINLTIAKSAAEAGEVDGKDLIYKYTALNRSNTNTDKDIWKNSAGQNGEQFPAPAIFNRVLWNAQSGWDGQALVLKNGATVTFPIDLFKQIWTDRNNGANGLTFEIEFETSDIASDDAIIMDYSEPNKSAALKITATEAKMVSRNNIYIKTNFKDNERTKIAFVFNPIRQINEEGAWAGEGFPNMMFIIVNGVLDRVCKWGDGRNLDSDDLNWGNAIGPNKASFTIGNPSGEATVKLYSIRIYAKALTPEEEFTNYLADAGDNILSIYEKNNVLDENGNIDFTTVHNMIRTLLISVDYTSMNSLRSKKANTFADLQYFDPDKPWLNFYARDCFLSCQGTSSMQYPIKNLRPYFGKTPGKDTFNNVTLNTDGTERAVGTSSTPEFETEFWPASEYEGHEDDIDTYADEILPLGTNKKVDDADGKTHQGFHKVGAYRTYKGRNDLANKWGSMKDAYGKKEYLYKLTGEYMSSGVPLTEGVEKVAETNTVDIYISEYRPILRKNMTTDSDEYWQLLKELRWSGAKMFTRKDYKASDGYTLGKVAGKKGEIYAVIKDEEAAFTEDDGVIGVASDGGNAVYVTYKETKKKKALKKGEKYYVLGSYWKQKDESGWTDRWTIKADYAESSNTHNGGTGRLWGAAMKNVVINSQNLCMTGAQQAAAAHVSKAGESGWFDLRTSCDCVPIVIFTKQFLGFDPVTGKRVFDTPKFAGLFNIMTDKGSTKLFGFEDLYDEDGEPKMFDAAMTQCWECLSNGSSVAQGLNLIMDQAGVAATTGSKIGDGRLLWQSYEARWPDTGQERHEDDPNFPDDTYGVESNQLESFWQWVNFTKPAVNYTIGGTMDGYDMNQFSALTAVEADATYKRYLAAVEANDETAMATNLLYVFWYDANNDAYAALGETYTDNAGEGATGEDKVAAYEENMGDGFYFVRNGEIDFEDVTKTVNPLKIGDWMREQYNTASDIYLGRVPSFDAKYRFIDTETGLPDAEVAQEYYVDVYMRRNGPDFYYTDNFGNTQRYIDSVDAEDFLKDGKGVSWKESTFMEFFSKTKYQHLDVYKCAAYYIYIMRFCAVDQVVKNTMMATEGPTESSNGNYVWWFINYDNDTILGVRNDGQLKFHWDCDRNTYDIDGNSYSFAGAKSVLWNNLAMDDDFMEIVRAVDSAMYSQGLLTSATVLNMYNDLQEGTWCERLYNEQERIKYLSTFQNDFSTDKFLLFMHGTRHSHRLWWITHRWELFDSLWQTGDYLMKNCGWLMIINGAEPTNPIEFLEITAASKYTFQTQSNNKAEDGRGTSSWIAELKAGETYMFKSYKSIAIGDPMTFIGPQKLKVMNFRPGTKYITSEMTLCARYSVTMADGSKRNTNWVNESGTMMTRFLIGDGVNTSGVQGFSGLENITSLEEIDFRGVILAKSTPTISTLVNLHRWRTTNSGMNIFSPAQGAQFYEVALNADTTIITLNDVTFLAAENDFADATVNYTDSPNAFRYSKTFDAETNTMVSHDAYVFENGVNKAGDYYVFDYMPTKELASLTLLNVKGLDTLQFIKDWIAAMQAAGIDTETRTLAITNLQWTDITAQELIDIHQALNITQFTGYVYLSGSDNGKLTQEEYDLLLEEFGEDAFKSSSALVLSAASNMFFTPTGNDYVPAVADDTTNIPGLAFGNTYYTMVRGESMEVNATIFPVSDDNKYVYTLQAYENNRWTSIAPTTTGDITYTHRNAAVDLVNNMRTKKATLKIREDKQIHKNNPLFRIAVYKYENDEITDIDYSRQFNSNYIYINIVEQIVPTAIQTKITGDAQIYDETEHEYSINFGTFQNTFNVKVKNIAVVIPDDAKGVASVVEDSIVIDNANRVYTFKIANKIQKETTTVGLSADITFATEAGNTIHANYPYSIVSVYPEQIIVKDAEGNEIEDRIFLNQCTTTHYTIELLPENQNMVSVNDKISLPSVVNMDVNNATMEGFDIVVKNNLVNGKYISFNELGDLTITRTPAADASKVISKTIEVHAAIVYPDRITIKRDNYNMNGENIGLTTNKNITLTDKQGTVASADGVDASSVIKGRGNKNSTLTNDPYYDSTLSPDYIYYDIIPEGNGVNGATITENFTVSIDTAAAANSITVVGGHGEADCVSIQYVNYPAGYRNEMGALISGVKGFGLRIKPLAGDNGTWSISLPITVTYDPDDNNDTTEDTIVTRTTETINVVHSIAAAVQWEALELNKVYAVDVNNAYYEAPEFDHIDGESVAMDSNNGINNAELTPDKWVGVVVVTKQSSKAVPICVSLRGIEESMLIAPKNSPIAQRSLANIPGVSATSTSLFNGYDVTYAIINNFLQQPTQDDLQSLWWKSQNILTSNTNENPIDAMYTGFETYIPSYAEMEFVLRNLTMFNDVIEYMINYCNVGNDAKKIPLKTADGDVQTTASRYITTTAYPGGDPYMKFIRLFYATDNSISDSTVSMSSGENNRGHFIPFVKLPSAN